MFHIVYTLTDERYTNKKHFSFLFFAVQILFCFGCEIIVQNVDWTNWTIVKLKGRENFDQWKISSQSFLVIKGFVETCGKTLGA